MKKKLRKKSPITESVELLKSSRLLIILLFSGFILAFIIGLFFPNHLLSIQDQLKSYILINLPGRNFFSLFFFIFLNNLKASLFAFLLGIILGIFPLISVLLNGYLAGAITKKVEAASGSYLVIFRLLPHGIFEIPAFVVSSAFGLRIGFSWFEKDIKQAIIRSYREAFLILLFIITPLLIMAALIETSLVLIFH